MKKQSLPKLNYEFSDLSPYIDEETMKIHYAKHHGGYVSKLNGLLGENPELKEGSLEELLRDTSKLKESIRTKLINFGGGHLNHELFWANLTPDRQELEEFRLSKEIQSEFSSISALKDKFKNSALGLFGSGWTWLVVRDERLVIMNTSNQDSPIISGDIPLLGIDLWEHAYYLNYKNDRGKYIDSWWNVVNWSNVNSIYLNSLS